MKQYQNLDPVIRQLKSWHKYKTKPVKADTTILGNKTFLRYFRKFNNTTINENTDLLEYQLNESTVPCLPLSMILIAFNISHTQNIKGHSGSEKTYSNFIQNFYFPNAPIWIKVLCNDCIVCQLNKPYPNQKQIAQKQDFKGQSLYFNHRISFDTKGPISPSSEGNSYIMVIVDAFTHYVALNLVHHCNAYYAYTTLYEHWIAKFGLPEILVTDNGTEFINNEIITLCHLYNIKHKPRTSHAPWTNGLVEGMNRSLQEYLRCIINGNDTRYTEWSADVKLFPLAYNSQITTTLGMSPYEMVFNQKPRKPIMFTANSHKNAQSYCQPNKDSICYNLPLHTHDEDHFHHPQILKLASGTHTEWILNRDKKHNEIYQKVTKKLLQRQNINEQINSRFTPASDLKIGTFVLIPNFNTQKGISKKLQPLRKGPYQIIAKPTDVTYKITDSDKKEIVQHRNNLLPYYPKEYALREQTQLYSFTGLKVIQNNPHTENKTKEQHDIHLENQNKKSTITKNNTKKPTSEQIRENPFNPTNQTSRLPYWRTHSFTQGEPNLINDPIDIFTDTTTSSSLPETLSLPSTPSISQISPTPFNFNFPNNLDARTREQSSTNIPLRLDWNTFTAPPPLFGQHPESNRLHNWALNRLQYRQDIHEDIRDHNIQILQQNSLQLKFEITVKLKNITQHPYPLNPPNITAQSLPPPYNSSITTTTITTTTNN